MVSVEVVEDSGSRSNSGHFPVGRSGSYNPQAHRHVGRSMRTIRTILSRNDDEEDDDDNDYGSCSSSRYASENLSESVMDMRLGELALAPATGHSGSGAAGKAKIYDAAADELMSDFSGCSSCSDISGELQRLACLPSPENSRRPAETEATAEEYFSGEIGEGVSPEELRPTVEACVGGLRSASVNVQRSAAAKLRLLAKNRSDFRLVIGEAGAVPALVPLLRCSDPWAQEHAVTALLNLSLHDANKTLISHAGAVKALVYALRTGTEAAKQNAACALLSLALVEDNRSSIGACGAIPPLVSLLILGSSRGKKDALTTLYKLCSIRQNKERAVTAGAVRPLVGMVAEQGAGMAEKALVVLSSLAGIDAGREAIVEEGGIPALVEAIEDGSPKGKEFAVFTLLQLCGDNVRNRGLLVREGGIPPLVALSQSGTLRAKHKAEALLGYLREPRPEAAACSSP